MVRRGEGDRSEHRTDEGDSRSKQGAASLWILGPPGSKAEVQAFPSDSSQRGTPPPLHRPFLGGLESAAERGLGFQAGSPTPTTSACMQRVGS